MSFIMFIRNQLIFSGQNLMFCVRRTRCIALNSQVRLQSGEVVTLLDSISGRKTRRKAVTRLSSVQLKTYQHKPFFIKSKKSECFQNKVEGADKYAIYIKNKCLSNHFYCFICIVKHQTIDLLLKYPSYVYCRVVNVPHDRQTLSISKYTSVSQWYIHGSRRSSGLDVEGRGFDSASANFPIFSVGVFGVRELIDVV